MRPLLIVAALVIAAAAVVLAPRLGGDDEPHPPRPQHVESVAAAYALTYARIAQVGDAELACRITRGDAARKIGCGSENRRVRTCGSLRNPLVVDYSDAHATIHVGECTIELATDKGEWIVTDVVRD
jgi:hypothetical protein